jgi:hypothetical protein
MNIRCIRSLLQSLPVYWVAVILIGMLLFGIIRASGWEQSRDEKAHSAVPEGGLTSLEQLNPKRGILTSSPGATV